MTKIVMQPRGVAELRRVRHVQSVAAMRFSMASADGVLLASCHGSGDFTWSTLQFEIGIPNHYTYHHAASQLAAATATAVGDLDCDGIKATYTLTLSTDGNGKATGAITPPESDDP